MQSSKSFYLQAPKDPRAAYLTPENFPVRGDGVNDDTLGIQAAINQVKEEMGYGIVFIPEGTYRITRTLYVPKAVRLIGYGQNRPTFVLEDNAPGFDQDDPEDKGQSKYLLWYVDRVPKLGEAVRDANAGTFYSALVNVDLRLGKGNPSAVALRTHFAQHSFIAHVDIHIESGRAGMFDAGNEMEDVRFFGGDYGIISTRTSPSWPFVMVDTAFYGQRKAALCTQEVGLTAIRTHVKDTPVFAQTPDGFYEKLYVEDSVLENITDTALVISLEDNSVGQINLRNVACHNVPTLARFRESGKVCAGREGDYLITRFTHGLVQEGLGAHEEMRTLCELSALSAPPVMPESDIPALPPVSAWVNLKDLGAKGDNCTDDTDVLEAALQKYDCLYLPQGWYIVTRPLKMRPGTRLIGLNPISTQLVVPDNCEAFGDVGAPLPLLEVAPGGQNILFGIGLNAGANNPRIVGCKWCAGAGSYMNDVKFVGGHGTMGWDGQNQPSYNANRTADPDIDRVWDYQYWSLWVAGGGGVFKDIWTASTFAAAGFYASDTHIPSRIYAMSIEHHCRNEVKFKNVRNWKVYGLQTEEEVAESRHCQPLELRDCANLLFANTYLFRVIWLYNPYPYAITTQGCRDIEFAGVHNFTQVKYTMDNLLYDRTSGLEVRPWQLSSLILGEKAEKRPPVTCPAVLNGLPQKLAGGFEFPDAITTDQKGNVYFSESRMRRIYRWDAAAQTLKLIWDAPFKPLGLAVDTLGNLLVACEFIIPKGATQGGRPVVGDKPNEPTSYGTWYRADAVVRMYAIDPENPEESVRPLPLQDMQGVDKVARAYYPGNRWRDSNDYLQKAVEPCEKCFVAPDGVTIIPYCYDLIRMSTLSPATPGAPFYAVDEYLKRTVRFDVDAKGALSNPQVVAERGEYGVAQDACGRLFVPNGQLYVYAADGAPLGWVDCPDRPSCVAFGGADGKTLYMTTRSGFYAVALA